MKCVEKANMTPEFRQKVGRTVMSTEEFNANFPVVGFWIFPGGIMVTRECALDSLKDLRTGRRQRVTSLSPRSLYRLALLATSAEIKWKSFLTLTYGPNFVLDGSKVKYHLNFLLTKLKRSYGPFDFLWFLEFQSRGAPHFHIFTTLAAPNGPQRRKFAKEWANIVEPGNWAYERLLWAEGEACYLGEQHTNDAVVSVHSHKAAWEAIKSENGVARYVAKYATKLSQKYVPRAYRNVGRFWGKA